MKLLLNQMYPTNKNDIFYNWLKILNNIKYLSKIMQTSLIFKTKFSKHYLK